MRLADRTIFLHRQHYIKHTSETLHLTAFVLQVLNCFTSLFHNTVITYVKMPRKKSRKLKGDIRDSYMFPLLHQDVVNAVSDDITSPGFYKINSDRDSDNRYSTHVMGKFKCSNNTCSADGWTSKKVAILIRSYTGNRYNAEVFNQRCKVCNLLGTLTLDETSYVDRIAYRIKKWAGVPMDQQSFGSIEGPPHEKALCEGCKRGVCQQASVYQYC